MPKVPLWICAPEGGFAPLVFGTAVKAPLACPLAVKRRPHSPFCTLQDGLSAHCADDSALFPVALCPSDNSQTASTVCHKGFRMLSGFRVPNNCSTLHTALSGHDRLGTYCKTPNTYLDIWLQDQATAGMGQAFWKQEGLRILHQGKTKNNYC